MNAHTLQQVNSKSRFFQPTIDSANLRREVVQPDRSPQFKSPPWHEVGPNIVSTVLASSIMLFIQCRTFPKQKVKQTPIRIEHHFHTVSQPRRSLGYRTEIPRWAKFLIAVVLPPLAVYLVKGFRISLWINIALTLFGYWPGSLHAFLLIFIDRRSAWKQ